MNNNSFQLTKIEKVQKEQKHKEKKLSHYIQLNYHLQQQKQQLSQKFIKFIKVKSFGWIIFRFLILTYYIIDAILLISFTSFFNLSFTTLLPLNIILFIGLLWDLFIKFQNISKPPSQKTLTNQIKRVFNIIFVHYMFRKLLILDTLVLLFFFLMFFLPQIVSQYFRLFVFLRARDIIQFNNQVYFTIYNHRTMLKIYTIAKIGFVFYLFSHYFGCVFFMIDQAAIDNEWYGPLADNPLLYYQGNMKCFTPIQALDDAGRYLYGLYFLVSLISTIAYGDIIGRNPPEEVLVTVLMVVATIAIALILQQLMGAVVQTMALYQFIKKYNSLKAYMDSKQVGLDLKNRVRSFLVYIQYEKSFRQYQPILNKLSLKSRKQILYEGYKERIGILFDPIIKKNSDIFELCNLIQQVIFYEEAQLFQPRISLQENYLYQHLGYLSHIDGQTLFYVQYDAQSSPIPLGQRNQYNFYELLSETSTRYGAIAKTLSHFAKINTKAFQIFLQSTDTGLIAQWYAQKILCHEINQTEIDQFCLLCKVDGHKNQNCPKMHLIHRNKDLINFDKEDPAFNNIIDIYEVLSSKRKIYPIRRQVNRKNIRSSKVWPKKIQEIPQLSNVFELLLQGMKKQKQRQKQQELQNNYLKQKDNFLNLQNFNHVDLIAHTFTSLANNNSNILTKLKVLSTDINFDSVYDPEGFQQKYKIVRKKDDHQQ